MHDVWATEDWARSRAREIIGPNRPPAATGTAGLDQREAGAVALDVDRHRHRAVRCSALLFSIAWHELGHLTFAKLFNVRTTQYMVGFGKTVWSKQVGETEYGFKAIPLGGYIRMIGMVPPGPGRPAEDQHHRRWAPAGMVRNIVEETRAGDRSQVTAADDGRQFYQLHPAKRIVVMAAGPVMNLILAVGIFAVLMVGIGVPDPEHHRRHASASASSRPRPPAPPSRPSAPPSDAADPGRACRPAARRHHRRLRRHPGHQLGPADRR